MRDRWRNTLAARRVRRGGGEPLPRFRWWQLLSRSLRSLTLNAPDGTTSTYTVDVRRSGDAHDGTVRARLYLDGSLHSYSKVPARFTVPGGHIEVAVGTFGLRRCHYVRPDGTGIPLEPEPSSAEGRRARLHRDHPSLSRLVAVVAALCVAVGLCVTVPQIIESISRIPAIADSVGTFDSPVHLPAAVNVLITVAAVVGSTERALRLRSSWLDDLAS